MAAFATASRLTLAATILLLATAAAAATSLRAAEEPALCGSWKPDIADVSEACSSVLGEHFAGEPIVAIPGATTHFYDLKDFDAATSSNIIVHLGKHLGDKLSVYVTTDGTEPSADNFAVTTGQQPEATSTVELSLAACSGCRVALAVVNHDAAPAAYYLTALSPDVITQLSNGVTITATAAAGTYNYYKWSSPVNSNNQILTFTTTPLSGDPDLYISTTTSSPSRSSSQWSSAAFADDTVNVAVGATGRPPAPATYYIAVYAFGSRDAHYTLLGSAGATINALQNAQPQWGSVAKHSMAFYSISLPSTFTTMQVTASPSFGDPDIFIDLKTQVTTVGGHAYSSSSSQGEDMVVVQAHDHAVTTACTAFPCTAFITVYGFTAAGYTLTAVLDDTVQQILDGVPVVGNVDQHVFLYYSFSVTTNAAPMEYVLTQLSGDADIFVSCHTHTPSATTAQTWLSARTDIDRIFVAPSDTKRCSLPATYYIGVTTVTAGGASYSLTAHVEGSNHPTEIRAGMPQQGFVAAGSTVYYQLAVGYAQTDIQFTLATTSGQASLYANNVWDAATGEVYKPVISCPAFGGCTTQHALWSSSESPYGNSIAILQNDANACTHCEYVVAVYAQNRDTVFTLTAISDLTVVTLMQNVPVTGHITAGNYIYFLASLNSVSQDMYLDLTTLSGDADLCASDTQVAPTMTTATWSAAGTGAVDSLAVQASSLAKCSDAVSRGVACEVFIGVYGYRNSTFSLTMTTQTGMAITLSEGIPQGGSVTAKQYVYYEIHGIGQDIDIMLEPSQGDPDLYVSVNGQRAGSANHQYMSARSSGIDSVTVPASVCASCSISVAVYGYHAATFTVRFNTATSVVALTEGEPQEGSVQSGQYRYYQVFNWGSTNDVTISVTAFTGDPDIFVIPKVRGDPDSMPNAGHYTWESLARGGDTVFISHDDPNFCSNCNYLIAVSSFRSNATYTITATMGSSSIVSLADGQPQSSVVATHAYRFYSFRDATSSESVTFTVTAASGRVVMYVTNTYVPPSGASAGSGNLPTTSHYVWASNRHSPAFVADGTLTITPTTPGWHDTTTGTPYTIGIYGSNEAVYTVTATSSAGVEVLQMNVPSPNHVLAAGSTMNFAFSLASASQSLSIVTTTLSGSSHIVVSTTNERPSCVAAPNAGMTCSNYTWASNDATGAVSINAQSPCSNVPQGVACTSSMYRAGTFYVGVYAKTATHFTLTVSTDDSAISLLDGVPQVVTTHVETICPDRAADEQCTGNPSQWQQVQLAYVSFSAALHQTTAGLEIPEVSLTVNRACDWEQGCPDTLQVYGIQCSSGNCAANDYFPSPSDFDNHMTVAGHYNTLVVEPASVTACAGSATDMAACVFHMMVMVSCGTSSCNPETFQVIYQTSSSLTTVSEQCAEGHLCILPPSVLLQSQTKFFELDLAIGGMEDVVVELTACQGMPVAYGCGSTTTCANEFNPGPNDADFTVSVAAPSYSAAHVVSKPAAGTFHIGVQGDASATSTQFQLAIGHVASASVPAVAAPPSGLTVVVTDDNADISWANPTVTESGGTAQTASGASFTVYAIPTSDLTAAGFLNTPCGWELAAASLATTRTVTTNLMAAQFSHLTDHTKYTFGVVALCGGSCVHFQSSQSVAYATTTATTGKSTAGPASPSHGLGAGWVVLIILVILGVGGGIGFVIYKRRQRAGQPGWGTNQYNAL